MQVNIHFAVFFATLFVGACASDGSTADVAPQAVRVVEARQGPVIEGRRYLADVSPRATVKVMAQVPGTVSALPVAEGEAATVRDVLVRVAAPDMVAKLSRVRSERERAERERDFACVHRDTDRVLHEAGDVSSEQLRGSEKNCASAELAVSAAKAAEQEVTVVTARSTERAPFDGVVLDHLVDVGQTVGPGAPMLIFGSTERELVVRLSAEDVAEGLGVGTEVAFDGGRGEVDEVGGQVKGPGRVVDAHITVTDGAAALPITGGTVAVRLVTDQRADAISVPLDALGGSGDDRYVLALDGDRVHRVDVTVGPRQDGWVAVEPTGEAASLQGARVVTGQPGSVSVDQPVLAVEVDG